MKIEEKIKKKYLYSENKNLPKLIYFLFQFLKFKFKPRLLYSNWGVDLLVKDILKKGKEKGIYIDVGCHHPFINNNTYVLYKKGWRGINVDLDFNSIDMFNYFRPNDNNIEIALSNKKVNQTFIFFIIEQQKTQLLNQGEKEQNQLRK